MARMSAEARSASVWRASGALPEAPKHLCAATKKLWTEVVDSRPADYFAPGSLQILEDFCVASVALAKLAKKITRDPADPRLNDSFKKLSGIKATAATKLRLAVSSSVAADSGKLTEKQPRVDGLIGGQAAWQGERGKPN